MFVLISPAKTLNEEAENRDLPHSMPVFTKESAEIASYMKTLKPADLKALMGISDKLADLNQERFEKWQENFDVSVVKQSVLTFQGDVYQGLNAGTLSEDSLDFAQKHLRILSGLYGILRPMDKMQPYRLEMGTKMPFNGFKNLYDFWGSKITDYINEEQEKLGSSAPLVNLASNEYFKVVKPKQLNMEVITPVFKDFKTDKYKVISFFAKKARGLMARYIIENQITEVEKIKLFDVDGYSYNDNLSKGNEWVFTRG